MTSYAHWSALLARIYRWIWIGHLHPSAPAVPRGSLILAAHYNGAIDGIVYGSQLPSFLGVVSSQWHTSILGRWLIPGIPLVRGKDRGSSCRNAGAFRRMVDTLTTRDCVLYFPEGTSQLGTQRLPVRRGTLLLLEQLRSKAPQTPIFFAAAKYHQPTCWRSPVSLGWIGPFNVPPTAELDESWVAQNLLHAQSMAYTSDPSTDTARHRKHPNALGIALACPYLPVWGAISFLAHRIADDENVIALWKFLLGVPSTIIVAVVYTVCASRWGFPSWIPLTSLLAGTLLWRS